MQETAIIVAHRAVWVVARHVGKRFSLFAQEAQVGLTVALQKVKLKVLTKVVANSGFEVCSNVQ